MSWKTLVSYLLCLFSQYGLLAFERKLLGSLTRSSRVILYLPNRIEESTLVNGSYFEISSLASWNHSAAFCPLIFFLDNQMSTY